MGASSSVCCRPRCACLYDARSTGVSPGAVEVSGMVRRSLVVWVLMLVMASINGAVREALLIPRMGDGAGRAISTFMLSSLVLVLTFVTVRWIGPRSALDAWIVGGLWFALTLGFEFLAGHFLFGNPWSQLLEDYNVFRGRIWILVLITIILAPRVCARARGVLPASTQGL
jgi:uncharacterized membrane protein YhaH (DUF805 family)